MEIASGLIRLKPDSNQKIEQWRETINSRLEEAIATLEHEGVQIESWFRVEIEGKQYLLWYMRAESIQKAFEVSQTFKHPIDQYHYELMASITESNILAKPLMDLCADGGTPTP